MVVAPASTEFSTSSLAAVARSTTTCPEQMRCTDATSMALIVALILVNLPSPCPLTVLFGGVDASSPAGVTDRRRQFPLQNSHEFRPADFPHRICTTWDETAAVFPPQKTRPLRPAHIDFPCACECVGCGEESIDLIGDMEADLVLGSLGPRHHFCQ
jgi:hypothetical protein